MPGDWSGFEATRLFRGVTYHISVVRAGEGNAVSLVVDGEPVAGSVVPLPPPGRDQVAVEVRLG